MPETCRKHTAQEHRSTANDAHAVSMCKPKHRGTHAHGCPGRKHLPTMDCGLSVPKQWENTRTEHEASTLIHNQFQY